MTMLRIPVLRIPGRAQSGFSLVELMVSIVIGLVILAAMVALFVNSSGSNRELARANSLIENGRLAIELLESDVVHAGYWGAYMPTFDDQTFEDVPADTPTAVPDPCLAYDTPWTAAHAHEPGARAGQRVRLGRRLRRRRGRQAGRARTCWWSGTRSCAKPGRAATAKPTSRATSTSSPRAAPTDAVRYRFGTDDDTVFDLNQMDCAADTEKRKFVSEHLLHPRLGGHRRRRHPDARALVVQPGRRDVPAQQEAVAMIEGIEGFRVELGIDDRSNAYAGEPTGTPVDYTVEVDWLDPDTRTTPTNRGDGSPDGAFVTCTTADPCTVDQLMNVTAVKIYVLVRSREAAPNYTDTKTYQVGDTVMGPFNDGFKRHVYVSTLRLPNIAGRRQTP